MQMFIYFSSKPVVTHNQIMLEHHSDISQIASREIQKISHLKLIHFQKIKIW